MNKQAKSTLFTIAEHLNLSVSTVSRALNGQSEKYRISKKTTERILKTAAEFNYRPNQLARGLRMKRTHTIGVIIPDITNPFFSEIVRSIENAARKDGVSILISDSNDQTDLERSAVQTFTSRNIDGLIISPIGDESDHIAELNQSSVPIVLIDRSFDSLCLPFIGSDNLNGSKEATRHLISYGHRNIGFLQGLQHSSVNKDRVKGYIEALEEAGIQPNHTLIVGDSFGEESGYISTKLLLNSKKDITAIFAASNPIALGAIKAIHEEHLSIPDDVSIVAFDDQSYCNYFSPPLTSVAQQTRDIGSLAYSFLAESVAGITTDEPKNIKLPTKLIVRNSVKNIAYQLNKST